MARAASSTPISAKGVLGVKKVRGSLSAVVGSLATRAASPAEKTSRVRALASSTATATTVANMGTGSGSAGPTTRRWPSSEA